MAMIWFATIGALLDHERETPHPGHRGCGARRFPWPAGSSNLRQADRMTVAIEERPGGTDSRVAGSSRLDRLLDEFAALLLLIPPERYETIPEDRRLTIARHVSRSLDLIEALVGGRSARVIAYQSPQATALYLGTSLRRISALRVRLRSWPGLSLDEVVRVEHMAGPADFVERSWSTLGHELAFIVNHIVDAQRVIGRVMHSCGICVPEGFGSMELQPLRARSSVPPSWAL